MAGSDSGTETSAGSATTSGEDTGTAEVRGVTDTTITVGGLGQVDDFPGMETGARARFERANAEGGVNGRTIEYVGVENDGSDASANLDLARDLVENQDVFAVIPATSSVMLPATTDYFNEQHTIAIGWGFMPGFCVDGAYVYSFNGCLSGGPFGVENPVNNTGLVEPTSVYMDDPDYTVSIVIGDNDSSRAGAVQWEQLLGDQVVHETFVPVEGVTDYSPYINEILDANPDAVLVGCDFACVLAMKSGLKSAGYTGMMWDLRDVCPGSSRGPRDRRCAREHLREQPVPASGGWGAVIEQIEADLEAIDEDPFVTNGVANGWYAADMFLQMVEAAGPDLTAEAIHEPHPVGLHV